MNDYRMEAALKSLAGYVPKPPEASVETMVKTVNALNAERQRRKGPAAEPAADKSKELTPRAEIKAPGAKKTL